MRYSFPAGVSVLLVAVAAAPCSAQSINGANAVFKSAGVDNGGGAWNLTSNGYLGTFIHLNHPGTVQVTANVAGSYAGGAWPQMDLNIANQTSTWTVANSSYANYTANFELPAGTFFVRNDFLNDYYGGPGQDRNLYVQNLSFSAPGAGLTIQNNTSQVTAASDSYIENYRKGPAQVTLTNGSGQHLGAGVPVHVELTKHAFNFGTASSGANLTMGSPLARKYQAAVKQNFNMIVPGNDGKWLYTEAVRGQPTMGALTQMSNFAQANDMGTRMHQLWWGDIGCPDWVNSLVSRANSGDSTAQVDLENALTSRIGYYVTQRANTYSQIDVVNESYHNPQLNQALSNVGGIGWLYDQTINAIKAAGANTRAYLNEYNVLDSGDYGNWYRTYIEQVRNTISTENRNSLGIGVQDYTSLSNADVFKTLQNLAALGYPISLTEFGVVGPDWVPIPPAEAMIKLQDHLKMVFGNSMADTFVTFGFVTWPSTFGDDYGCGLYDANFNITETGKVWQQMLGIQNWGLAGVPDWDTDLTLMTDANGQVNLNGFYGDYNVTALGLTGSMTLLNGVGVYTVVVPGLLTPGPGDANGDDLVNDKDASILGANWLTESGATWEMGDFNKDGKVNDKDAAIMAANWTTPPSEGDGSVPEPGALALLAGGLIGLLCHAWRKRKQRKRWS